MRRISEIGVIAFALAANACGAPEVGSGGRRTAGSEQSAPGGEVTPSADGGTSAVGLELVCPTKAPFDTSIPGLVEKCTDRVLLAGFNQGRLLVSRDGGASFTEGEVFAASEEMSTVGFASGYGLLAAMTPRGVYVTSDAVAWTKVPATNSSSFSAAIAFHEGRFIAGGTGGTFSSADGRTWTGYVAGDVYPSGIKAGMGTHAAGFFNGRWLLAGELEGRPALRSSTDASSWADQPVGQPPVGRFTSIAAIAGHAVLVGAGAAEGEALLAHSVDGITWTMRADAALGIRFVVSDGKRFVGFGNAALFTSPDGTSWARAADAPRFDGAAFGEGVWFGRAGNEYSTSADGVTWTRATTLPPGASAEAVGVARLLKRR